MLNSMALSVPYDLFHGSLNFRKENKQIDSELKTFGMYLKRLKEKGQLSFDLDTSSFLFDIGQGLFFDSTIPQGFGVGSSGALVAAVYDRYAKIKEDDLNRLKLIFATMEGHFHGSSSGVDPLISYLETSILIDSERNLKKINSPSDSNGNGGLFLLNTGRPRKTEPLVNLFLEKLKLDSFKLLCEEKIIPVTNDCIKAFISNDKDSLWKNFSQLSAYQFESFNPMIPKLFQDLWLQGLEQETFSLKLCGAGGGGFLLGLTKNFDEAADYLNQYEIRPVLRF